MFFKRVYACTSTVYSEVTGNKTVVLYLLNPFENMNKQQYFKFCLLPTGLLSVPEGFDDDEGVKAVSDESEGDFCDGGG